MSGAQQNQNTVLSWRTWFYMGLIFLIGMTCATQAVYTGSFQHIPWLLFIGLTILASLSELFVAEIPNTHVAYFATPIFVFAGVLLLEPWQFVVLTLVYHMIEWAKERLRDGHRLRNWYIQPFNVAVEVIAATAARWVYTHVELNALAFGGLTTVLVGTSAALAFVIANHVLLGLALMLARGKTWRQTGMLSVENVLSDMVFLLLGYLVAILWQLNPALILPALSPLVLMYRALRVPILEQEAQTDSKTGLLNPRYFDRRFEEEFARTERFQRPLALIMADLDYLRHINNSYGHLAGDIVIAGIGHIISQSIREYDFAGRFGGEEFAIVLPETRLMEAQVIAERIRTAVEAARFEVATSSEPIQVTMSLGVAHLRQHMRTTSELTQAADAAVYQAKAAGRNQAVLADSRMYDVMSPVN